MQSNAPLDRNSRPLTDQEWQNLKFFLASTAFLAAEVIGALVLLSINTDYFWEAFLIGMFLFGFPFWPVFAFFGSLSDGIAAFDHWQETLSDSAHGAPKQRPLFAPNTDVDQLRREHAEILMGFMSLG